ncbi:hypothetical protein [Vagococcus salmoninarum]|uniref:hypothetical protein n=1 Tax=Vagococcus salmoninarum TaxID=2739 RepID=UPI00398B837C
MKTIKKPIQPKLPHIFNETIPEYLDGEELVTNTSIEGMDYTYQEVSNAGFQGSLLTKTNFSGSSLRNFEAQDVIFDHCDFF